MTVNDHDLVGQFVREQSQDAFTALVNRYLNLVYSAALRQVRSPQLAEEVCQTVFTHLAQSAGKLAPGTLLTAWLYQVTRHTAIDVVRREARRQAREQIAFQMSEMNDPPADWTRIEPLLDEAMQSLDAPDRAAILLRYFENKSLREVGEALGASEDAAQKRVSRALERLREFFSKRRVTVGVGGLAALVSVHAVQAAPSGLAASVAAEATLTLTTISTTTAITLTKTIVMTTMQKAVVTLIATIAAGGIAVGFYQARQISNLRSEVQALQQEKEQQATLGKQVQELKKERDGALNRLAALAAPEQAVNKKPNEVLKLRGEVSRLQRENIAIGSSNALSKVTADPVARKQLRDQQKLGMSMIYKGFAQRTKLTTDQTDKLNDLLADHIMDNVGHVTTILRDKLTPEQMNQVFSGQDGVLQEKVVALLGQDGWTQYQDYTKNLLSSLTGEQFKGMLSGTDAAAKDDKGKQVAQIVAEEAQAAVTRAGLPADYQTVPMLNFVNIASEQAGEQSLQLLDDIYQHAAARLGSVLSPEELTKFQEFRTTALNNNRLALTLNRTIMAPISDKP